MMAKRRKAADRPDLQIEVDGEKKTVTLNGSLSKEQTRMVLAIARQRRISIEEALRLMLETGAKIMEEAKPVDGQSRSTP
ncbi:MAG TPA: hypothetical protein VFI41_05225 [Gemmatimonadales bacterium]|nr:hypothetical protein [Gemmatimonadales bacterium]